MIINDVIYILLLSLLLSMYKSPLCRAVLVNYNIYTSGIYNNN